MNEEQIENRIREYYKGIVYEKYSEEERDVVYNRTIEDVLVTLIPYAKNDNYWWEEKSEKMAYYQLHTNLFVVRHQDFKKYYHKLMGEKFDSEIFSDGGRLKETLNKAHDRYNQICQKQKKR